MSFKTRVSRCCPVRFVGRIISKCWASCGAFAFICFILYWLYGGIFLFFLLCFATTGVLYRMEDLLLYHPELPSHSRVYVPAPSMFNLPYQSVYTRTVDGTMLHMFFISQPDDKAKDVPTVLFLHGNAGNMGHRLQNVSGLYHNIQCNVLMLEYRGYGLSQGTPSEEGLYMDARAGLDYLSSRNDINHNEIIVFGRSLGGAVAIDLATRPENSHRIWCLILENTFTSIPDMAALLTSSKLLQYVPLLLYKNKYMSLLKISSVSVPTLFVSGLGDALVPPRMMTELYKRCNSSCKRMLPIPGGTHNETWNQSGYYKSICDFLAELRQSPPLRVPPSHWQINEI
ncbi:protein ABHD13 [Orussus abietinus]|uniref:protein ABHD13 n=1 Tax=Orussus abietinus TaxID=222816 RepID=UPI0006258FEB|nr:protein ABHD13 [Orussus abietinus]